MKTPFPAYQGDDPYVFVCYSHADQREVFTELAHLHDQGVNVYYDEGISPGHEWTQELADAIDGCRLILYFVSSNSVGSRHCRNEVQYGLNQNKPVIAVHLEPAELSGGLKLTLGTSQAILKYAMGDGDYRRKLLAALEMVRGSDTGPANGSSISFDSWRWRMGLGLVLVTLVGIAGFWAQERYVTEAPSRALSIDSSSPKLAVLPFINLSGDRERDYFSDGISEDILSALARQVNLTVRARDSSFLFKGQQVDPRQIAKALDVSHLVNGSVRAHGDRIRVTVRLTDVAANEDIWSNTYDREIVDVFAVQDDIAEAVVRELGAQFSDITRRSIDVEAYDAFLLGRSHYHVQDFKTAEAHLIRAVELDPDYAEAHALLARVYETQAWNSPPDLKDLLAASERHISAALALDPEQPLVRGLQALQLPIQAAINELHGLVGRYPNDEAQLFFYSTRMRMIGRGDLELDILNRSRELNPLFPPCPIPRIMANLFYGHLTEADDDLRTCEALGIPYPIASLQVALLRGDVEEARRQAGRPVEDWALIPDFWRSIGSAMVAKTQGDRVGVALALEPLMTSTELLPFYPRYMIAALNGDIDQAIEHFEAALLDGEPYAFHTIQGSFSERALYPELFNRPQYQALLRRYGLDQASISKLSIPELPFAGLQNDS